MTEYQKKHIQRLRSEGMSYNGISTLLGISENTVKSFCRRNNLRGIQGVQKLKKPTNTNEDSSFCMNCGKSIEKRLKVKRRKFCSDSCRLTWWNGHTEQVTRKALYHIICAGCGCPFESYGNKKRKYCNHDCYIKARFKSEVLDDC